MDLKESAELQRFILNGRVLNSFGAIKEKARSPYVLRWQQGCTSSSLSDERNVLNWCMVYSELIGHVYAPECTW